MKEENKIKNFDNGFLIRWFAAFIQLIHFISPVEQLKKLFVWISKSITDDKKKQCKTYAIDTFILVKWLYLILIIIFKSTNHTHLVIVPILIFFNLFSYFYYHIWDEDALLSNPMKINRVRRRFLNVISAISFSHVAFAYLYYAQYYCNFSATNSGLILSDATNHFSQCLWYSISNSIAANYDAIKPNSAIGYNLSMIQLIVSFIFITIILSKSLPDAESNRKDQQPTS